MCIPASPYVKSVYNMVHLFQCLFFILALMLHIHMFRFMYKSIYTYINVSLFVSVCAYVCGNIYVYPCKSICNSVNTWYICHIFSSLGNRVWGSR